MTTETSRDYDPAALPQAEIEKKRRFSLVWLIPIVAAVAGAFVLYKTFAERGPLITIVLQAAAGIEPGKTPIKYRDVQVGVVDEVTLTDDFKQVIVTARMDKTATAELREGTQFWIENARITAGGVSGLGTLLSGAYIGMRPGSGNPARNFVALDTPPVYQVDLPGKTFTLRAERLGSVSAGAPIYFRGIQVGGVLGYKLDDDGNNVSILAFVRAPYDAFVRHSTHFWNASGINVQLTGGGVEVRTESLQSVLIGGIAFDSPLGAEADTVAQAGREFPLYATYDAIQQAQYTIKVPFRVYFEGSVSGLEPGSAVTYNGLKLGEVTAVGLEIDPAKQSVRIPVTIALEPQRWRVVGQGEDFRPKAAAALMAKWVDLGLRAQLQSGNLLTGQKIVALQVFPTATKASVVLEDLPVIPTMPSQVEQLTDKVTAFLDKLDKAQIDKLVADARGAVQAAEKLLASPSLRQGMDQIKPLLETLDRTADAARTTLASADATIGSAGDMLGADSALRYDLVHMIKELTAAARSMRVLADFVERNPNALILGKPLPEQP